MWRVSGVMRPAVQLRCFLCGSWQQLNYNGVSVQLGTWRKTCSIQFMYVKHYKNIFFHKKLLKYMRQSSVSLKLIKHIDEREREINVSHEGNDVKDVDGC